MEKADDVMKDLKTKKTNFEYLQAKVETLEEAILLIQDILNANNLVLTETKKANMDIEGETWKKLE